MTWVTLSLPVKPAAEPADQGSVGPDLTLRTAACPSCGAGLRADAQWCSLCYHDLRPAPAPVIPEPTPAYGGEDPLTAPLLDLLLPPVPVAEAPAQPVAVPEEEAPATVTWPCLRCGTRNALDSDACRDCGNGFLGGASEGPSLVIPGVGDMTKMSRGGRLGLALGVVLAVMVPLALITWLMTDHPAPQNEAPVVQQSQPQTQP